MVSGLFQNNIYIESVKWSKNCTFIPSLCFDNCRNLKYINNIEEVLGIGYRAFSCSGIKYLDLSATKIRIIGNQTFSGSTVKKIVWPNECHTIGDKCFLCSNLTDIINIEGVETIGEQAFSGSAIEFLDLSKADVSEVNTGAFTFCSKLKEVVWSDKCESIPSECFFSSGLYSIKNTSHIEYIGNGAFGRTQLRTIDLSQFEIDEVGTAAFRDCRELASVTWNSDCDIIPSGCFSGCSKLNKIVNTGKVTKLGELVFNGAGFTEIDFPQTFPNIREIGIAAFQNCSKLRHVIWSDNSLSIANQLFADCPNLENVTNLDSVAGIGHWAFAGSQISEIDLSGTLVPIISPCSFDGCEKLTNIIPPYYGLQNRFF